MSSEDLKSLQQFDPYSYEVLFSGDCTAWNEKTPSQTLDGVLFIVKRTIEPSVQMILKRTNEPSVKMILKPGDTDSSDLCGFVWEASVDLSKEVEKKPIFLLPTQSGFIIFFNNLEDSTRARDCIKRLSDTSPHEPETTVHVASDGAAGASSHVASEEAGDASLKINIPTRPPVVNIPTGPPVVNIPTGPPVVGDHRVYLQNSRMIMAMIAVLLATVVLTVGLNPPSIINSVPLKIMFQLSLWIAALFSFAALLSLCAVTPTSFEMEHRILRCAYLYILISMVCVALTFSATTLSVFNGLFSCIVGAIIGFAGVLVFLYFSFRRLREFIYNITGFLLTQNGDLYISTF